MTKFTVARSHGGAGAAASGSSESAGASAPTLDWCDDGDGSSDPQLSEFFAAVLAASDAANRLEPVSDRIAGLGVSGADFLSAAAHRANAWLDELEAQAERDASSGSGCAGPDEQLAYGLLGAWADGFFAGVAAARSDPSDPETWPAAAASSRTGAAAAASSGAVGAAG